MKHIINVDEIKDFEIVHDLASSVGRGNNKHLSVYIKPSSIYWKYRVTNNKINVYEGQSIKKAVNIYNQC